METMRDQLLTTAEVAEILSVKPGTIRTWVWTGKIPSVKIGRLRRFLRSELDAWIEERMSATNGEDQP